MEWSCIGLGGRLWDRIEWNFIVLRDELEWG